MDLCSGHRSSSDLLTVTDGCEKEGHSEGPFLQENLCQTRDLCRPQGDEPPDRSAQLTKKDGGYPGSSSFIQVLTYLVEKQEFLSPQRPV